MGTLARTPLVLTYKPRAFSLDRSVTDTANPIRRSPFACMALSLSWGPWRACLTRRPHSTRRGSTPCCARTGLPTSPSCLLVCSPFFLISCVLFHPPSHRKALRVRCSFRKLRSWGRGNSTPPEIYQERVFLPWSFVSWISLAVWWNLWAPSQNYVLN